MIRRAAYGSALLVLCLAACGSSSSQSRTALVLDHSIGPVSLLETRHDVERAIGKGVTIRNDAHYGHQVRYKTGLDVFYASGPKHREVAFAILTTSGRYRTRDGIGVGSTLQEVASVNGVKCYGTDSCQHGNTHNKPGTALALRAGKVWRIVVTILD